MSINDTYVARLSEYSNSCIEFRDYLKVVNPSELTAKPAIIYTFIFLYTALFLFGMVGNCGMNYSILRRRLLCSSAPSFFLFNLGAADVLLCFTAIPLTPSYAITKRWHFGWFMCKTWTYSQGVSVLISSLSLCAVSVDRFWSIVETSKERLSIKLAYAAISVCWVGALVVNLPFFISMELQPYFFEEQRMNDSALRTCGLECGEYKWYNTQFKQTYGTVLFLMQFVLPVFLMSYCYWKILRKVHDDLLVNQIDALTCDQQAQAVKRRKRVTYILILMVIAFVTSWLPLMLINLLRDYDADMGDLYHRQPYLFHLMSHSLAMTSVVWNPLLYFWMNASHREWIKKDIFSATRPRRCSMDNEIKVKVNASILPCVNRKPTMNKRSGSLSFELIDCYQQSHIFLNNNCAPEVTASHSQLVTLV